VGLTLLAVLAAALLLPGLIAAQAFYSAADTREVEVAVPALSTSAGIALVGGFSIAVHFLYALALYAIAALPDVTGLPLANPYIIAETQIDSFAPLNAVFGLFSGLILLCILAWVTGHVLGLLAMQHPRKGFFYGPLTEVIEKGRGDDRVIAAYVLSKIEKDEGLVGYRGNVVSLFRDADRYPAKLVLKDVAPFFLKVDADGPQRIESRESIDWLSITADDWHNVAFRVYTYIDDEVDPPDPAGQQ
jgi:hypothetical protein